MTTDQPLSHVFGPVPSRRLGLSLGVDLIPAKTCTFDCLYCQVGRTTHQTLKRDLYVPVDRVLEQLRQKLGRCAPDAITLAGSGEPTLHAGIDQVISGIRSMSNTRLVLLTNGSLFWMEEVRQAVRQVDCIMPTLCSAFVETFKRIHRPHSDLDFDRVLEGLKALRREYSGDIFLETVLLKGMNDTEAEVQGLKTLIDQIKPDRVQLNTVVRPPSDSSARALDREKLEEIRGVLGQQAEIVADVAPVSKGGGRESRAWTFLDMVKRRPLRAKDAAVSMGLELQDMEDIIQGLLIKGFVRKQEHGGDVFYVPAPFEQKGPEAS